MQVYQRESDDDDDDDDGAWSIAVNALGNSSHTVTSLAAGTTYQFYVLIHSYGKTDETDIITVTTGALSITFRYNCSPVLFRTCLKRIPIDHRLLLSAVVSRPSRHLGSIRSSSTFFEPVTEKETHPLLTNSPAKSCFIDPAPTWFLKQFSAHIVPVILFLGSLSLQTGTFPSTLKHSLVRPHTKKPTLDPEVANNYRFISNLPYISKADKI